MIRQLIAGAFLCTLACGGPPRNTALKNRVSDERLAPISLADRAAESEAHQSVFLAEWQLAFTEGQLDGAQLEIKIAKNNLASAKLGMKSAKLEKKAADESGDTNKIKSATQASLVAEKESEVHKISIDRAKQSMAYLKKRRVYEQSLFRSLEAKLEYARAKSLSAAGIVPPNFKLKTYKAQYSERQSQAKSNKSAVDSEHKQLKSIDQRLAKAKIAVQSAKNPNSKPAESTPVAPIPSLPPPPPEVKVPTPDESRPGDPGKGGESTPASDTKAPDETPTPAPAPAPEKKPEEAGKSPASTNGGQS